MTSGVLKAAHIKADMAKTLSIQRSGRKLGDMTTHTPNARPARL